MEYIAEIGWNFMGDMKLAEKMIADAKEAGATCVKFQYWNPSKLKPGPWDSDGRRSIYEKAFLTEEKLLQLQIMAGNHELDLLVSSFNADDAAYLKQLGLSKIKIPSHASHDLELHKYAIENFSKCYVSLGACSVSELNEAIMLYESKPNLNWVAMHCVSSYPCEPSNANLLRLNDLKICTGVLGYSDHTIDVLTPSLAVALGARVIEKHFTSDKSLPGRDNQFAVTKAEFASMVSNCEHALEVTHYHGKNNLECELDTINNYRGRWG